MALDVEALNRMTPPERLAWTTRFVDEDLLKMDSSTAFQATSQLITLAKKWKAPEIEVEAYFGQGNYLLKVLNHPENAISTYSQGIDFANRHDLKIPAAGLSVQMGNAYLQLDSINLAYEYYFRAQAVFVRLGYHNIARINRYEYEISHFLCHLDDYGTALEHLDKACLPDSTDVRYQVLTLTGQCHQEIDQGEKALEHFQKCFRLALKEENPVWLGKAAVDIGAYYLKTQHYPEARIYLATGYRWNMQVKDSTLAARALVLLSNVNIHEGNLNAAAQKLTEAESYLQQSADKNWLPDLYRSWVEIFELQKNYEEAHRYQILYDKVQNPLQRATDLRRYQNIQLRHDARSNFAQKEFRAKKAFTDGLLLLVAGCLLILGAAYGYRRHLRVQRQQKELLSAKQRAEDALKSLQEKNKYQSLDGQEVGKSIPAQVLYSVAPPLLEKPQEVARKAMDQIVHMSLLTEEDSRQFRLLFEKIHPGFFAEIRTNLPDLTQSETRLLALTKLNLSTKEMSEILNIEPNSIRRLRNRIRQKLSLPAGDNFEKILQSVE